MKTIHELSDEYRNFSGYDPSPTVISNRTDRFYDLKQQIARWRDSFPSECELLEVHVFFTRKQNFEFFAKNLKSKIETDENGKMYCDYDGIRFKPYFSEVD